VREFSSLELASSDKKSWFYKIANLSPVGDIGSVGSSSTGSDSTSIHHAMSSSSHTHHHHSSTSSSRLPEVPGHKLREEWNRETTHLLRSIMLFLMIDFASSEILYCSKTLEGCFIN
jgi:hypothetical protein